MRLTLMPIILVLIINSCVEEKGNEKKSPVDYVNTFIGTSNAGNTFPGAVLPWGMVSVSPHNCFNFQSDDETQT
jgi:putative alpha-1,2-mannosidase